MSGTHESYIPTWSGDELRSFSAVAEAAMDRSHVTGWTHNFYRYPARFSPQFAAAAIEFFSNRGDLDPYMGGGTAVVEGMAAGRHVVGNDLNSLAAFIVRVKILELSAVDVRAVKRWATKEVPKFNFHRSSDDIRKFIDANKTVNLTLVRARFIKKAVAAALASIAELATQESRDFARCVVLRVSQWALDGRERHTPLSDFRKKLTETAYEMLRASATYAKKAKQSGGAATILNRDARDLHSVPLFQNEGKRASLVVTSPVLTKNSEHAEKARVLGFTAVVSPACLSSSDLSSLCLPADSVVERLWS